MAEPSLQPSSDPPQTGAGSDKSGSVHLLTDDRTFSTLEQAVRRTHLGRWFIREIERRARSAESSTILDAIGDLRESIESQRTAIRLEVFKKELDNMSDAIAQARQDISAIRPDVASNNRIMAATEELDAIVTATERATSDILGAAEAIQTLAGELRAANVEPALCDRLETEVIDIFTACTFQDITGQRTTKVVNVLRYLEERVNSMIEIWGVEDREGASEDASLLSGPAKDGEGVSQDEVDRMLGELFDS